MNFDGLEPRRCEDIKKIVAPEIGPKSFETFEKQAADVRWFFFFRTKSKALSELLRKNVSNLPRSFTNSFLTNKTELSLSEDKRKFGSSAI